MSDPELTEPVRRVLRKYVLELLAVPSVFLTITSMFLGFALNDWAKAKAYSNAFDKASGKMLEMAIAAGSACDAAEDAGNAQTKIKAALNQLTESETSIRGAEQSAAEALRKINAVDVFALANSQVDVIANAVLEKTNITERVASLVDQRLAAVESLISKQRVSKKGVVVPVAGGGPWGDWKEISYEEGCQARRFLRFGREHKNRRAWHRNPQKSSGLAPESRIAESRIATSRPRYKD